MKKITILSLILFLLMPPSVFAAGTMSQSGGWQRLGNEGAHYLDVVYVDDGSGTTGTITLPSPLYGKLPIKAVHINGATAITSLADITIKWHGVDVFGGGLEDLSNTVDTPSDFATYAPLDSSGLTFTLSGNSVVGATGTIRIYIQ